MYSDVPSEDLRGLYYLYLAGYHSANQPTPTDRRLPRLAFLSSWLACMQRVYQDLRVDSPRPPHHRDYRGVLCDKAAENKQLVEIERTIVATTHPTY